MGEAAGVVVSEGSERKCHRQVVAPMLSGLFKLQKDTAAVLAFPEIPTPKPLFIITKAIQALPYSTTAHLKGRGIINIFVSRNSRFYFDK